MILLRNYLDSDYLEVRATLEETKMFDEVRDNRENLRKKIEIDSSSIIVAADSNKVIGNVYLMYDGVFAFIFRLAVKEAYQNLGVGGLLLQEAEKRLCQKGARRIALWVRESELVQLQLFYEKRGYQLAEGLHQCLYKEFS